MQNQKGMLIFKVAFGPLFSNINLSASSSLDWVLNNQSDFDWVLYMHHYIENFQYNRR